MVKELGFEYSLQIKEHHLDSFGHVNNATYLELYEEARWQFITENGYGYKEVHEFKKGPVILDCHIRFKNEILLRERLTIKSNQMKVKGKIMYLEQEMIKENGKIASSATFTIGFMDLAQRKLIEPTKAWLNACGAL
jgi:YbgC/YbaW family acyl-CoA thioester hydrolase